MKEIVIENPEKDQLISDILEMVSDVATKDKSYSVLSKEKEYVEGAKGEILTAIAVSIAAAALYDLIKLALKRFKKRKDYDLKKTIIIDGKTIIIEEIQKR